MFKDIKRKEKINIIYEINKEKLLQIQQVIIKRFMTIKFKFFFKFKYTNNNKRHRDNRTNPDKIFINTVEIR